MKNITIAIDDETYRKARILAAERGTSLSAMVKAYLLQCASEDRGWRKAVDERNRMMAKLLRKTRHFAVGAKPTRQEMHDRGNVR